MTADTKRSFRAQINSAVKRFEAVQHEYSDHGACDTEPCAVFRKILRKAVQGETVNIPTTGHSWELYSTTMDCTAASAALFQAAKVVVDAIQSCPIGESAEVQKYVKNYCWD